LDEEYAEETLLERLKEEGYGLLKKVNGYLKYLRERKESEAWVCDAKGSRQPEINQLTS